MPKTKMLTEVILMRPLNRLRITAVALAIAGIVVHVPSAGAQESLNPIAAFPESIPAVTTDVALDEGGSLRGWVLSQYGAPLRGIEVTLEQSGQVMAIVPSDDQGQFAIAPLRGGVYQLRAARGTQVIRAWAAHTAPAGALEGVVVVAGQVARGQIHPLAQTLANPWVIAAIVAAAVIIPVAIHNNRDDRPSGS
jgi:hypothetical protein